VKRVLLSLAGLLVLYVGALAYVETGRLLVMLLGLGMVGTAYLMKGPR